MRPAAASPEVHGNAVTPARGGAVARARGRDRRASRDAGRDRDRFARLDGADGDRTRHGRGHRGHRRRGAGGRRDMDLRTAVAGDPQSRASRSSPTPTTRPRGWPSARWRPCESSLVEIDLAAKGARRSRRTVTTVTQSPPRESADSTEDIDLQAGTVLLTSLDGVGPALMPSCEVGWTARSLMPSWLALQGALAGFGSRPTVTSGDRQRARRPAIRRARACSCAVGARALQPYVALSAGVLRTAIDGQADAPGDAHFIERWSFLLDASLGARLRLTRPVPPDAGGARAGGRAVHRDPLRRHARRHQRASQSSLEPHTRRVAVTSPDRAAATRRSHRPRRRPRRLGPVPGARPPTSIRSPARPRADGGGGDEPAAPVICSSPCYRRATPARPCRWIQSAAATCCTSRRPMTARNRRRSSWIFTGSAVRARASWRARPTRRGLDPEGVIMAFPDGLKGPAGTGWNVGPCCVAGVDDVAFARGARGAGRKRSRASISIASTPWAC